MNRAKFTLNEKSEICKLYSELLFSCNKIAKIYECDKSRINSTLKSFGIKLRSCAEARLLIDYTKSKHNPKLTDEYLLKTYGDDFIKLRIAGLNNISCSNELGIGPKAIGRLQKLLNIKRIQKWQKLCLPEMFTDKTISLIYGTLMGDASLHVSAYYGTHKSLTTSHSPKQKAYLEHKRNLLKETKPYPTRTEKDKWGTLSFRTSPHPAFNAIYDAFYSSGTKQITNEILEKLTPEAIALWFMDDGSNHNKKGFSIATCSFSKESINNINIYFSKTYDIYFTVTSHDYFRLHLHGIRAIKFKELIIPYIIPEMMYKLELNSGIGSGKSHSTNPVSNL